MSWYDYIPGVAQYDAIVGNGQGPINQALGAVGVDNPGLGGLYHQAFDPNKPDPAYVIDPKQFDADKSRLGAYLNNGNPYNTAPQVGRDPYSGGWAGLVNQLQNQASGNGPSMAEQSYRRASQDSMGQLSGMAAGSASPGAAREAMLQQGRIGQGMASGLASARTQEQMAAQGMLGSALTGAGNSAFQRDALNANLQAQTNQGNQSAWLDILAQQMGLTRDQLQAMIANQTYATAAAGQQTAAQKALAAGSSIAGTVAAVA